MKKIGFRYATLCESTTLPCRYWGGARRRAACCARADDRVHRDADQRHHAQDRYQRGDVLVLTADSPGPAGVGELEDGAKNRQPSVIAKADITAK